MTRTARWLALALLLGAVGSVTIIYVRWLAREQRYNQLITEIAEQTGVDPFLIKAVMRQESGFDPFAYSSAGAIGLMQVMEGAGRDWARATGRRNFTRESLWNERTNIAAGAWYLGQALRYWQAQGVDDPVPFALAEYNAGRANAQRWLPGPKPWTARAFVAAIKNSGVRHYIEKVSGYYDHYRERGHL